MLLNSYLSRSRFVCTNCGSLYEAEVDAAENILKLGISSTGGSPGRPVNSSQTTGRKQEDDAKRGKLGPSGLRAVTNDRVMAAANLCLDYYL